MEKAINLFSKAGYPQTSFQTHAVKKWYLTAHKPSYNLSAVSQKLLRNPCIPRNALKPLKKLRFRALWWRWIGFKFFSQEAISYSGKMGTTHWNCADILNKIFLKKHNFAEGMFETLLMRIVTRISTSHLVGMFMTPHKLADLHFESYRRPLPENLCYYLFWFCLSKTFSISNFDPLTPQNSFC